MNKYSTPKYKDTYLKRFDLILVTTIFFLINTFSLQANTTHKIITFEVTVPTGVDASAVSLEFPKLKYNKKVTVSWINDDSYSIWNNIFCLVNKKWVDDAQMSYFDTSDKKKFYPHHNWTFNSNGTIYRKTTGYIPSKFLEYTDGAGIKYRFASTVASWWNFLGERNADAGILIESNSAKETRLMADFGFTVAFHDVCNKRVGKAEFDSCISIDSARFSSLIDRVPKIMVEPNNWHEYIDYSKNNNSIQMIMAQSGDPRIKTVYPFNSEFTLDKTDITVQRIFAYGTGTKYIDELIAKVQTQHDSDEATRTWIIGSVHRCTKETDSAFFNEIERRFGATGDDSVWFPSIDEFFEYWYSKKNTTFKKEVEGQKIRFTLDISEAESFYFHSISVLLNGISKIDGVNVTSGDNVFGTSFGINDNKLLVNLNFNESLPERAERYVSIYKKEKTIGAYEDAIYFISQLKTGLKEPYINRINSMTVHPILTDLAINNGAETTENNLVSISFKASETASYYRISESANFENTEWLPLVTSTLFNLSSDLGNKIIYAQLKNAVNESVIISTSIELLNSEKKVVIGFSGDNLSNTKEFVNGKMLNNVNFNMNKGWKNIQLYDTSDNPVMKLAKDTAVIRTAKDKYGITDRVNRGAASQNPVLSGDEGEYPDRFITNAGFFGSNNKITPETRRLIAGLIEVPNGNYDLRILSSKNGKSNDFQNYRYQANNSAVYIPNSDFFNNNNSKYIEIKNVNVNDNTLLICSWREPFGYSFGFYAPINLIEIKPSLSTAVNNINSETIKVFSCKGKLIIKNESLSLINIHSIDGRLIKQFEADHKLIEVPLLKGIYIINGKKGVVY